MKKTALLCLYLIIVWGMMPLADAAIDSNKQADKHFGQAVELLKGEDHEAAIAEYEKVIELAPESEIAQDAQYWIGQSYFRMGQYDEALSTFGKLVRNYPESAIAPVTQLMMAQVQQEKERPKANGDSSDKGVVIDPKTGVKYTKIRTFTGKNDVIQSFHHLNLSPNEKFLLWGKSVVPMDGGEPFDLVDMPIYLAVWSPDGRKVVFSSERAIWVLPVSPETGKATGSAKKLLDRGYLEPCCWSPDSERVVVERRDKDAPGNVCILSVVDGTLTQITNWSGREWGPIWSPDGKTIAYLYGYQLRVIPAEGGIPRKLIDEGIPEPVSWSPDSRWLIYEPLKFLNLMDERRFEIKPAWGKVGGFFGWSPGQSKMLFYKSSYDWRSALKVVSVSGGPSIELGRQVAYLLPYGQYWSSDSEVIITKGENKGESVFWVIPLSGKEPFPIELEVSVSGKLLPLHPSLDCRKLAFAAQRDDGKEDIYVVPISVKDGRTIGPAVLVFDGWDKKHNYAVAFSWSPDGTKIALSHEWNIWMAYADGSDPVQVTHSQDDTHRASPSWSPDGTMLAYKAYISDKEQLIKVISVSSMSENEDTVLLDLPRNNYEWTPDSRSLLSFDEETISAISIADGKSRQVLDLKDMSVDGMWNLSWSPDRRTFAFIGYNYKKKENSYHIFAVPLEEGKLFPVKGSKLTELATDDTGEKYLLHWSPDGKWISYQSDGFIKTRTEGAIWEADVSELLSGGEKEQ